MSSRKSSNKIKKDAGDFVTIGRRYLSNLQEEYKKACATGEATPELSYRPVLNSFFVELSDYIDSEIRSIFEPRKQMNAGRPDWRFYNAGHLGVYGYVEAKGLEISKKIRFLPHQVQIEKYKKLGVNIVLTDGIEFIFFDVEGSYERISLVKKPLVAENWSMLEMDPRMEAKLRKFFSSSKSRTISESELVKEVARRAVEMSASVAELAALQPGEGFDPNEEATIKALHLLKELLQKHHDPDLNEPKIFADFVAQVLAFGLFFAHRVVSNPEDSPVERLRKVEEFWFNSAYNAFTGRLRPFKAIIKNLRSELMSTGRLGVWYRDTLLLLAHVKLTKNQSVEPDYHILYQDFLNAFNPDVKFDFGAFITPQELSAYTVTLSVAALERWMPDISLFAPENKIIDPCCGTGTFLEKLFEFAGGLQKMPEITGFEILPAPYALAHYRLSMLRGSTSTTEIVLTNTLSDELETSIKGGGTNIIRQEQNIARNRCKPPLTMIIGNPPSSDSYTHADGENFQLIDRLIDDFRPPTAKRKDRQNIQKQLKNPFVKFLRWSCEKLVGQEPGVLALLLPASFADKETYKYARKWLVEQFYKIWILDFDEDLRTGSGGSSLFLTQQGRLLLLCITGPTNSSAEVSFGTITHLTRQQKLDWLTNFQAEGKSLDFFHAVAVDTGSFSFRPTTSYNAKLYSKFWGLYSTQSSDNNKQDFIFERHCSGVKLAPSSLFVHVNKSHLLRRSRDIANNLDVLNILDKWFLGQSKPPKKEKFTGEVKKAIGKAAEQPNLNIRRYSYRPFLNPYILQSDEALKALKKVGGGTRPRPEIQAAYEEKSIIGISVAPDTTDIGSDLHRFVSFCWNLPDNDLCSRGNSEILCNVFPEYKKSAWDSKPFLNINDSLITKLKDICDDSTEELAKQIVFYTYAVLCSSAYLKEFESVLFVASQSESSPRIPVTSDKDLFLKIAGQGKALAHLEDPDAKIILSAKSNELLAIFKKPFKLASATIDEENGWIKLLDDNGSLTSVGPISSPILSYEVSGYKVIRQWLKLYSYKYTRAEFTENDFRQLIELLERVRGQISLISKIDRSIQPLLKNSAKLIEF